MKKLFSILLACVFTVTFALPALAADSHDHNNCGQFVVVDEEGNVADFVFDPNKEIRARPTWCCEPNAPKSTYYIYYHTKISSSTCEYDRARVRACDWCGAYEYLSNWTYIGTHRPGSLSHCPF